MIHNANVSIVKFSLNLLSLMKYTYLKLKLTISLLMKVVRSCFQREKLRTVKDFFLKKLNNDNFIYTALFKIKLTKSFT